MLRGVRTALVAAAFLATTSMALGAEERIISLGGSVTEILYRLDMAPSIIAVDSTSIYPPEAQELPDVGYLRQLAAEPIIALSPTLIVGSDAAGPPVVLDQLRASGVPLVLAREAFTVESILDKIAVVAEAVGKPAEGAALAESVRGSFEELSAALEGVTERPSVLFLLAASKGAPMAAGAHTGADAMIQLSGGSNAISGFDGYKNLSPEAAIELNPSIVVIAEHALLALGGMEGLQARFDLGMIPAIREGRVLVVDANLFVGFGPRAAEGAWILARALHPEVLGAGQ